MSAELQSFETAIMISPVEQLRKGEYEHLPLHLNVVDPFIASREEVARLISSIVKPKVFEITGFEHKDRGNERLQRLGGSALHNVHDSIVESLDSLHITHDNEQWQEGTTDTWYSGTWHIPNHRTKITQLHVAQEVPGTHAWQILDTCDLYAPGSDFRQDPLYLDSLYNPVNKRKA